MSCVTSKDFYRENLPVGLPIFYQPFYLDAVTAGHWDISCFCEKGELLACMPYPLRQQKHVLIRQPPFTIYLGPLLLNSQGRHIGLGKEMEILAALEASITPFDYYNQNWHPSNANWLPFHWKGYVQSTRYSYKIPAGRLGEVRDNYNENVRRNIKKASGVAKVCESVDPAPLFAVIEKTFDRKAVPQPYDFSIFRELICVCQREQCCKILLARDSDGSVHAGMFVVWDDNWVYYIAGGIDDKYKQSGAMTLLFDSAIEFAMTTGRSFDFEGSMIQPIEKFFRSFGATQQQYFVVTKVNSRVLRICLAAGRVFPMLNPF